MSDRAKKLIDKKVEGYQELDSKAVGTIEISYESMPQVTMDSLAEMVKDAVNFDPDLEDHMFVQIKNLRKS